MYRKIQIPNKEVKITVPKELQGQPVEIFVLPVKDYADDLKNFLRKEEPDETYFSK